MEAKDIRAHRKSLGLSRQEVADVAGVTVGALASIEAGRKSRDKEAEEKILTTMSQLVSPTTRNDQGVPAGYEQRTLVKYEAAHPDRTVVYEWNGLEVGSRFTVVGEEGVFAFVRHVTSPSGSEWIDCYGGERNYPTHARSFAPDRITPM